MKKYIKNGLLIALENATQSPFFLVLFYSSNPNLKKIALIQIRKLDWSRLLNSSKGSGAGEPLYKLNAN